MNQAETVFRKLTGWDACISNRYGGFAMTNICQAGLAIATGQNLLIILKKNRKQGYFQ